MVQLLDHIADGFELADGGLARVRRVQSLRPLLLNRLERFLGDARFVSRHLGFSQLGGGLLLRLLADIENLLKTKLEWAHDAFLAPGASICLAIATSDCVEAANAELSSGSC